MVCPERESEKMIEERRKDGSPSDALCVVLHLI